MCLMNTSLNTDEDASTSVEIFVYITQKIILLNTDMILVLTVTMQLNPTMQMATNVAI